MLINFTKHSQIIALMVTTIVESSIEVVVALITGDANICRRNKKKTTRHNIKKILTLTS